MFTPAIRATAATPLPARAGALLKSRRLDRAGIGHDKRQHDAHPAFRGPGIVRELSPTGCGVCTNSSHPRQPLRLPLLMAFLRAFFAPGRPAAGRREPRPLVPAIVPALVPALARLAFALVRLAAPLRAVLRAADLTVGDLAAAPTARAAPSTRSIAAETSRIGAMPSTLRREPCSL